MIFNLCRYENEMAWERSFLYSQMDSISFAISCATVCQTDSKSFEMNKARIQLMDSLFHSWFVLMTFSVCPSTHLTKSVWEFVTVKHPFSLTKSVELVETNVNFGLHVEMRMKQKEAERTWKNCVAEWNKNQNEKTVANEWSSTASCPLTLRLTWIHIYLFKNAFFFFVFSLARARTFVVLSFHSCSFSFLSAIIYSFGRNSSRCRSLCVSVCLCIIHRFNCLDSKIAANQFDGIKTNKNNFFFSSSLALSHASNFYRFIFIIFFNTKINGKNHVFVIVDENINKKKNPEQFRFGQN